LVNPSGHPGHWFELDLLQEHYNFWLKRLFNSKSHDFDAKHLSEAVGLNIRGFSSLRDIFPGLFGLKKTGQHHTDASTSDDIDTLGAHFRSDRILTFSPGRDQPYQVKDEFAEGFNILSGGQLQTFLQRTMKDGPGIDEGNMDITMDDVEYLPTSPVTLSNGVMGVSQFITGD
jgi:hypothetical protein